MADGAKEYHRRQEGNADGGRDQHGELCKDHECTPEQEGARDCSRDHAGHDTDAHFTVGLLHLVIAGLVQRVRVVGGQMNHIVY